METGRFCLPMVRVCDNRIGKGQTSEPKRGRSAKKPSPKDATQRYITGLLSSENEHAASVAKFVEEVAQRAVLRTPSSLRDYVELLGLRPLAKPDRYAHARRIGAYLLALSPKDAEEKITTGRNMTEVTSSLAGWTNIIVKPEPEK
jgi:hypothetical protein